MGARLYDPDGRALRLPPARDVLQARRAAVGAALLAALIGGLLAFALGEPAVRAAVLGCAGGLCGIAGWSAYHLASRRCDAFMLLALPMAIMLLERSANLLGPLVFALAWVPLAALLGLARRQPAPDDDDEPDDEEDDEDEHDDGDDRWDEEYWQR
jgi:hypothetical protein